MLTDEAVLKIQTVADRNSWHATFMHSQLFENTGNLAIELISLRQGPPCFFPQMHILTQYAPSL